VLFAAHITVHPAVCNKYCSFANVAYAMPGLRRPRCAEDMQHSSGYVMAGWAWSSGEHLGCACQPGTKVVDELEAEVNTVAIACMHLELCNCKCVHLCNSCFLHSMAQHCERGAPPVPAAQNRAGHMEVCSADADNLGHSPTCVDFDSFLLLGAYGGGGTLVTKSPQRHT
jgi:hypothetical protein